MSEVAQPRRLRFDPYLRGWLSVDGFVLVAVAWLIAGPRLEIVRVAASSIRVEDLLLLALLVLAGVRGWTQARSMIGRGMLVATGAVLVTGLASALIGVVTGRVEPIASVLYVLRPIEYWVVFPAAVLCLKKKEGRAERIVLMLGVVTTLQVAVGVLQVLGLPIGFSKFTYERAAGLTAGPYELGAICAMLACFWLYKRHYVLTVVALVGVVLSQSRISLAAIALGGLVLLIASWGKVATAARTMWVRRRGVWLAVAAALLVACIVIIVWLGRPVIERLSDTSIIAAWADAQRFSAVVPPLHTADEYYRVAFDRIDAVLEGAGIEDVSNVVRFFRWQLLLVAMMGAPFAWMFGLGPSFAGPSVDGTFLRVIVEFGIVGFVAWVAWFYQSVRAAGVWIIAVLATLLVGATTIDLMFALRPMVLFWFLAGVARIERPILGAKGGHRDDPS